MYHYVYKVTHIETGQFYIGSRSCNVMPSLDINYMGSMKTWKPDKTKLIKEIIKDDFISKEDAIKCESNEIRKNIHNKLNENYNIPDSGWHTLGMVTVKDTHGKTMLVSVDDPRYISGELVGCNKGHKVVRGIEGKCVRISIESDEYKNGDYMGLTHGKAVVKDKNGKRYSILKNDPKYTSGEYISIAKNKVNVKDADGNTLQVDTDDERYISGELVGTNKGNVVVKDSNGTIMVVSTNDPRYVSGELIVPHTGMVNVIDINGKSMRVNRDDPRYISGELISTTANTEWICNDDLHIATKIKNGESIPDGWRKGKKYK
ncbi:MAG: hypothetical protein WC979_03055 [Candidatus Pacearchaeota archaeon]|nr:hypothetical protein [Clostridia bacterium]